MKIKIIAVALLPILLSGCGSFDSSVKTLRDKNFTQGCIAVESGLGFNSYFQTTNGKVETCKIKCSKSLPKDYSFKYENTRTGCSGSVGAVK